MFARTIQTFRLVLQLIRWHKPAGTLLLVLPSIAGLFVATDGIPDGRLLVIFALGAFATRSLGCIVNDILDRNLDAKVARTRTRPLASGELPLWAAVMAAILMATCALYLLFLLPATAILAGILGAFLLLVYPLAKRYVAWPQLVLGLAFSWGIVVGWAVQPSTETLQPALLLFAATYAWIQAYDTIYALCDRSDDYRVGINSSAIVLGRFAPLGIAGFHLLALALWGSIGAMLGSGYAFWVFLALAAATQTWQVWVVATHTEDKERLLTAFASNGWTGVFVLLAVAAHYWH